MKLKTILYKATIILPICSKIIAGIRFIVDFNKNNKEVLSARNEIVQSVKYLQQVINEINDFHHINNILDGD